MTVDLLSVRLKECKRELTALKTAHQRGLGELKIFRYPLQISGYNDHVYELTVTVDFDPNFTAYPFVSCTPQCDPVYFLNKADIISFDFTNNGRGAVFVFSWFAFTQIEPYTIMFHSSVPIVNVEYEFVRTS